MYPTLRCFTFGRCLPPTVTLSRRWLGFSKRKKKGGEPKESKDAPEKVKCVTVFRYDPEECEPPYLQQYEVDPAEISKRAVLDYLFHIKNEIDPTLAFRRSCREGICGACAMNINGKNGLACITVAPRGDITIHPLPHLYVIKDLVVDLSNFYRQYQDTEPWLQRCARDTGDPGERHAYRQSERDRAKLDGMYECILCACCSTSCPAYWWHGNQEDRFLGPAALLHVYRWVIDSRDDSHEERLHKVTSAWNLYRCHTIFNCTTACPKNLNPGQLISRLKLMCAGKLKKECPDMNPDDDSDDH